MDDKSAMLTCVTIKELPENAVVYIYGACRNGIDALREIRESKPGIKINGFIDAFKNGDLEGVPIYNVNHLKVNKKEFDLVLVVANSWMDISRSLKEAGIENFSFFKQYQSSSIKKVFIIPERKLIYCLIPKAANVTIRRSLCNALGISWDKMEREMIKFVDLRDEQYRDHFKFTFVRNPWDRAVSGFEDKFNTPTDRYEKIWRRPVKKFMGVESIDFKCYLDYLSRVPDELINWHWGSQASLSCDEDGELLVDFVGRYENLSSDLNYICDMKGIRDIVLGHFSKAPHRREYNTYYDDKLKNIIYERYRNDIEKFGYSFD